jgi:hypothetical protein
MLDQFFSLLTLVTITLAAYGMGRPIVRGLGVPRDDRLATNVWSIVVGLIVAGGVLGGLGLAGLLYDSAIGVLSLAAGFWGVGEIVRDHVARRQKAAVGDPFAPDRRDDVPGPAAPARWLGLAVLLLAAAACLGSLVGALAPPTAGDALCYHLELPKIFLADHAIRYLPYHDNSTFPLLAEMWYLWALALDGPVAAGLVHWGLGILLGLAAVVLARPILGRPWAWAAGCIVVLTPGVSNQMTAPLNDIALAVLTTLALAAWWRVAVNQEDRRWLILAGLAGGGALGTKYIALIFAVAVAATWVWAMVRRAEQRRMLLAAAATVAVVAASVGGPWYVRAAWHRHNPVYPFLAELHTSGEAGGETGGLETLPARKSPLGRSAVGLAIAPWQITMHPERFGGRAHQLGVLFLVAAPGLFFARRLRGLGTLLAVAAVYGVVWFLLRQNVRFLFPTVPLLAVAVAWVWIELRRFPTAARVAIVGVQAVILVAYTAVAVVRCEDRLAVAVGLEKREDYLSRCEPSFAAATVANLMLDDGAHILSQDCRAFYFDARVTQESVYRRLSGYDRRITSSGELGRALRRAGFTHLLLAENTKPRGIAYDPTLSRLANVDRSLRRITESYFADTDGGLRHYRLVALPGVAAGAKQR